MSIPVQSSIAASMMSIRKSIVRSIEAAIRVSIGLPIESDSTASDLRAAAMVMHSEGKGLDGQKNVKRREIDKERDLSHGLSRYLQCIPSESD